MLFFEHARAGASTPSSSSPRVQRSPVANDIWAHADVHAVAIPIGHLTYQRQHKTSHRDIKCTLRDLKRHKKATILVPGCESDSHPANHSEARCRAGRSRMSEDTSMNDRMTPYEVATRLNLTERTLERWRFHGFGPPFVKVGRQVFYVRKDLDTWLNEQTRQSRPPATVTPCLSGGKV